MKNGYMHTHYLKLVYISVNKTLHYKKQTSNFPIFYNKKRFQKMI